MIIKYTKHTDLFGVFIADRSILGFWFKYNEKQNIQFMWHLSPSLYVQRNYATLPVCTAWWKCIADVTLFKMFFLFDITLYEVYCTDQFFFKRGMFKSNDEQLCNPCVYIYSVQWNAWVRIYMHEMKCGIKCWELYAVLL